MPVSFEIEDDIVFTFAVDGEEEEDAEDSTET